MLQTCWVLEKEHLALQSSTSHPLEGFGLPYLPIFFSRNLKTRSGLGLSQTLRCSPLLLSQQVPGSLWPLSRFLQPQLTFNKPKHIILHVPQFPSNFNCGMLLLKYFPYYKTSPFPKEIPIKTKKKTIKGLFKQEVHGRSESQIRVIKRVIKFNEDKKEKW